jgi:hypothetical protein
MGLPSLGIGRGRGRCAHATTMRPRGPAQHRENSPSSSSTGRLRLRLVSWVAGSSVPAVPAEVTQAEIAALLAVAQDHAFAQPPGSQLRATVLGQPRVRGGSRRRRTSHDRVDVRAPIPRLHRTRLRHGRRVRGRDRDACGVDASRLRQSLRHDASDGHACRPRGTGARCGRRCRRA